MSSLLFTVCMYEQSKELSISFMPWISLIDATSKFFIPLSINVLTTSLFGLVLTAYKILPGKFFIKYFEAFLIDFFLMQYTGSVGSNSFISS